MAIDLIIIGLSIATLLTLLALLFFLFEIKLRVGGELSPTFVYLILAALILIARRIYYIFYQSDLAQWPYVSDILSLIFAVLMLLAAHDFYKVLSGITDENPKSSKNHKRKKSKTANLPAARLSQRNFRAPRMDDGYIDLTK